MSCYVMLLYFDCVLALWLEEYSQVLELDIHAGESISCEPGRGSGTGKTAADNMTARAQTKPQ